MEPCTIGDITLSEDGGRLRLTIDEEQPHTWWTVAGARMAVEVLQDWIREQGPGAPPLEAADASPRGATQLKHEQQEITRLTAQLDEAVQLVRERFDVGMRLLDEHLLSRKLV